MQTHNHYNFGAGPAMLPQPVLDKAKLALSNWQGTHMSILEIGHRTPEFMQMLENANTLLRELLNIPDNYHVLWLGGAARQHFSAIPLNFLNDDEKANYIISGLWSKMAFDEASLLRPGLAQQFLLGQGPTYEIGNKYIYLTPNETVDGIRLDDIPQNTGLPLIADMTSFLFTETFDIKDYVLVFAGAQKLLANAGLTLVIIQDEFLKRHTGVNLPSMIDYRHHVEAKSLYATPPTFNCYLAFEMLKWLKQQGGIDTMTALNIQKSKLLYDYIDESGFYHNSIQPKMRSRVNVCFTLKDNSLNNLFLEKSKAYGLYALQGHRLIGGMRASIYNAMPLTGVQALITFMQAFAKEYGA